MSVSAATRILVAEDDRDSRQLLEKFLTAKRFVVTTADDGSEACRRFFAEDPDLVLLDVTMPQLDGWSVLKEIRSSHSTPVIMLTILDSTSDKVKGLIEGADDYVTKPFDLKELEARIHAVLRRATPQERPELLTIGGLTIDDNAKEVRLGDTAINLSPKEYDLLRLLASSPGRVFSSQEITRAVWPERMDESSPEDVKKYIYFLRNKLKSLPAGCPFVCTVRGFGYKLVSRRQPSNTSPETCIQ